MSDYFYLFSQFLEALPTFLLNGMLATLYWLADSGAALVSVACAAGIAIWMDAGAQNRANFRPARSGRQGQNTSLDARTAQIITGVAVLFWIASQWGMGAPVPWIGAAMWGFGFLVLLLVRQQETTTLWNVKAGILIYALAVLGSRLYLAYTAQLSPEQWAALIGHRNHPTLPHEAVVPQMELLHRWWISSICCSHLVMRTVLPNLGFFRRPGSLFQRWRFLCIRSLTSCGVRRWAWSS